MRQQSSQSYSMEVMSEHLRGSTARSLDLLRNIDGTIDALVMTRKVLDAQCEALSSRLTKLSSIPGVLCEKETIPALEASQESLRRMAESLRPGLEAARRAPELRADDGVVEAYEELIAAVSGLNQEVEKFRWAIIEHNADMEGPHQAKVLSSPQEIAGFLDSL